MFSFWHAQGGWLRRAGAEVVPLLLGVGVAGLSVALLGPTAGGLLALGSWLVTSGALALVRRRAWPRRLYRAALLAHVLFWCARGVVDGTLDPPSPPEAAAAVRWGGARTFRAGVAEASFWQPEHPSLAGWSQRPRRVALPAWFGFGALGRWGLARQAERDAQGRPRVRLFLEPEDTGAGLGARALVLVPEGGGPTLAIVRLDLTTSDAFVHAAVLEGVADLGVTAPTLLVAATHTHSGLGGYARDPLAQALALDHFDPQAFDAVVTAAVSAVRQAHQHARPARVGFGAARDREEDGTPILARRRGARDPDDVDDRVLALRVEVDEGRLLALLLNYGVHPVSVRREHRTFDRDLVGAVEEQLASRLAGRPYVLFLNGALGDVAPRVVRSSERPGVLVATGERFADVVAPGLLAGPLHDRLDLVAARVERDFGDPWLGAGLGDRGRFLDQTTPSPFRGPFLGVVGDVLTLPANAAIWSLGFTEARVAASLGGALGLRVNLERGVAHRRHAVGGLLLTASGGAGAVPTRLPLLWVPGEPTTEVGRAWREAWTTAGEPAPMVVGLANGSMAYVTSAREQRAGGYEALATLYGSDAERLLTQGLNAVRAALLGP